MQMQHLTCHPAQQVQPRCASALQVQRVAAALGCKAIKQHCSCRDQQLCCGTHSLGSLALTSASPLVLLQDPHVPPGNALLIPESQGQQGLAPAGPRPDLAAGQDELRGLPQAGRAQPDHLQTARSAACMMSSMSGGIAHRVPNNGSCIHTSSNVECVGHVYNT